MTSNFDMLRDISNAAGSNSAAGPTTKTFTRRHKAPKGGLADDDTQQAPLSPVSQCGSTTPLSSYSLNDSPCCSTSQSNAPLPRSRCQSSAGLRRGRRSSLLRAAAVPGHQLCTEAPASRSLLLLKMSKARQRALQLYTEQMAQFYAEVDEFELIEESPGAPDTKTKKRTEQQKPQDVPLQTPALPLARVPSLADKHSMDAVCKQGLSSLSLTTRDLASKSIELLTGLTNGCKSSLPATADDERQQEQTCVSDYTTLAAAAAGQADARSCASTAETQRQQHKQASHALQQQQHENSLLACTPAGPHISSISSNLAADTPLHMELPGMAAAALPVPTASERSSAVTVDPGMTSSGAIATDAPLLMHLPDTPAIELLASAPTRHKSSSNRLSADTALPTQPPDTTAVALSNNSAVQPRSSNGDSAVQFGNSNSSHLSLAADLPLPMRVPGTAMAQLSDRAAIGPDNSSLIAGSPSNNSSHQSLAADTPLLMHLPDTPAVIPSSSARQQIPGLLVSATPEHTLGNEVAGEATLATTDQVAQQMEQLDVSADGSSRQQAAAAMAAAQQQQASSSCADALQLQQHLQQLNLVAATPEGQPAKRKTRVIGKPKPPKAQGEQGQTQRKQSARQAAKQQQQEREPTEQLPPHKHSARQQPSKQKQKQSQEAREALHAEAQQQRDQGIQLLQQQDETLQELLLQQQAQLQQQVTQQLQQLDEQQLQQLMQQMEQQLSTNAAQQLADVEAAAAVQAALTPLQQMLQACGQSVLMDEIPTIADFVASVSASKEVVKLGEGTYGEAFKSGDVVFKFVPMEGSNLINGWPQKGAADLLGEAVIALTLSELSQEADASGNLYPSHTEAFVKTHRVGVCHGPYPKSFIKAWHAWDKKHHAENDPIDTLPDMQLYAVFAMANCGKDLEGYTLLGYDQARSMMLQVAVALAIAEDCLAFEHRDLHWGNIMLTPTPQHSYITARLRGSTLQVATHGAAVRLIDFTASRLQTPAGDVAFCNLELEDGIFDGPKGKPQFETYRRMRKLTNKDWSGSFPGTNVLWMLYMTELMLGSEKPIPGATAGQKRQLREFKKRLARYNCCGEVIWDELFCELMGMG